MVIAAYVRVSSKSQDYRTQRDAIARACKARGELVGEWFEEKTSGVNERPELRRLRNLARGGRFSKVYVYRLDRLSRGGICETVNLVEEFRLCGCQVESIADGFSFEGPACQIVLACLAWAAEMERSAIRERVAAARARVEASGGTWGRPRKVGPEALEVARNMLKKRKSVRSIAAHLKIPVSTLHDALAFGKPPPEKKQIDVAK